MRPIHPYTIAGDQVSRLSSRDPLLTPLVFGIAPRIAFDEQPRNVLCTGTHHPRLVVDRQQVRNGYRPRTPGHSCVLQAVRHYPANQTNRNKNTKLIDMQLARVLEKVEMRPANHGALN